MASAVVDKEHRSRAPRTENHVWSSVAIHIDRDYSSRRNIRTHSVFYRGRHTIPDLIFGNKSAFDKAFACVPERPCLRPGDGA